MSTNDSTSQTTLPLYITLLPASSSASSSISASESSSVSSTSTSDISTSPNNDNSFHDGYLLAQPSEASNEPSEYTSDNSTATREDLLASNDPSEEATTILGSEPSTEQYQSQRNPRDLHPDQRAQVPDHIATLTLGDNLSDELSGELSTHSFINPSLASAESISRESNFNPEPQQVQGNLHRDQRSLAPDQGNLHPDQRSLAPDHPAMLTLQENESEETSDEFNGHPSTNSSDPSSNSTEFSLEQSKARSRATQLSVASGPGPIIMARGSAREIQPPRNRIRPFMNTY